jgi:alkanesulfonate monooxygenase SsuD/methylene tetrahydromethanopterin reductase-like flavin-dependent oxidoreductase (luciferase family)
MTPFTLRTAGAGPYRWHMQVDVLLDPFGTRWSSLRDAAAASADAGFAGIWTWDHLDGRVFDTTHVHECWTVLTAISVAIPDVLIGPLVLNVANRHPGVLAVMAATLQDVSGGRLLLGLGAGGGADTPYRREQEAIGRTVAPDPIRRAEVEACVEEVTRLWRTPGFLEASPAPPFVIGAFGPKMAELAGRIGDGINTQATHPRLEELVAIAREAHRGAGRDPASLLVTVFTALHERWLRPGSQEHRRLSEVGVNRLILYLRPSADLDRIAEAGRMAKRLNASE